MFALFADLFHFARAHKKLWILPLVCILLLAGVLIIIAETASVSPFVYTLF